MRRDGIPAFLNFGVEPDGFQVPRGELADWTGYDALDDLVEWLRAELAEISGRSPRFNWFVRTDPQMAAVCPSVEYAITGFADRTERLVRHGDAFGVHTHPIRWSESDQLWVHDYDDAEWSRQCIESSFDAFERAFSGPVLRHWYGGSGFMPSAHMDLLEARGVRIDMSNERRSIHVSRRLKPVDVKSGIDGTPHIGTLPDCTRIPRTAYRPALGDGLTADDRHGRNMIMIPATASCVRLEWPRWRRAASRVKHGLRRPPWRMLHPSVHATSPKLFWDLVARELESMARPYMSIGIRTDAPGCPDQVNARAVIEYLPRHPLARHLVFVDPLEVGPSLLARPARRGLSWVEEPTLTTIA